MSRTERWALVVLAVLLLLGLVFWRATSHHKAEPAEHPIVPPVQVATTTPVVIPPPLPVPPKPSRSEKPVAAQTSSNGAPLPPKLELHPELIPKNIEIVRCYYTQEVAPPGTTFGFDINGSGFTREFEKMIKVESGVDAIRIKNLHLVTANQIHGEMEVGLQAPTAFVYPRVLIQGKPVFSAPEPFAVIRKGEVLTVYFTKMEESGRGGRFRVLTHLDDKLIKTFTVTPSTPGIQVSDLQPQMPYVMDGHLEIGPGVPPGEHGLTISIEGKERFKRLGMIRIVRPNVGQSGFVQGLIPEEKYYRPGDAVQIYVQATGLSADDTTRLSAKVPEFNIGQASFTYISPLQLRLTFQSPANMPVGSYSVQILSTDGKPLFEKKDLFQLVPANWVAGVRTGAPVTIGRPSPLHILGRDFSEAFAASMRIETDDPGITITGLKRSDDRTMSATIVVAPGVASGDYWLHLSADGKKISPPYGSIIKIQGN